ncbi:MAG TPA: hypothetical protein PLF22_07060 [Pseudomonadales bacterium]|nr:hypothetical protein [Pseudomonadales bacterium]
MHTGDSLLALRAKNVHDELRRINRMTGLEFQCVPESLLGRQEEWEAFAESLLAIAMATWKGDVG